MKKRLSILLTVLFITCLLPVFSTALSRGDVDGDNKITASDARLTLRCSVGLEKFNKKRTSQGDMYGDGKISAGDARRILRISVGLSEENAPSNDYEILRSGKFYIEAEISQDGVYYENTSMAVCGDTVYILSYFDGVEIGMLIDGDELYMIYHEKKAALHLSEAVLSMIGLSSDIYSSDNINFSDMPEFGSLKKERTEEFRNINCTVYSYTEGEGISEFYMNGNKLVRHLERDSNGNIIADMPVIRLSADVPAEYMSVPDDYKIYRGTTGMLRFMDLLQNGI